MSRSDRRLGVTVIVEGDPAPLLWQPLPLPAGESIWWWVQQITAAWPPERVRAARWAVTARPPSGPPSWTGMEATARCRLA